MTYFSRSISKEWFGMVVLLICLQRTNFLDRDSRISSSACSTQGVSGRPGYTETVWKTKHCLTSSPKLFALCLSVFAIPLPTLSSLENEHLVRPSLPCSNIALGFCGIFLVVSAVWGFVLFVSIFSWSLWILLLKASLAVVSKGFCSWFYLLWNWWGAH